MELFDDCCTATLEDSLDNETEKFFEATKEGSNNKIKIPIKGTNSKDIIIF